MPNPFDQFDAPSTGPVYGPPPAAPKPAGPPSGYAPTDDGLTYIKGGPADPYRPGGEYDPNKPAGAGDDKTTTDERTAAFLTTRLLGSLGRIGTATKADPSSAKPPILPKIIGAIPMVGDDLANWATDSERQQVEAAQLDAVDSALTLGTGAAYTPEQLESYRKAFFPQLGDSADTIKSKQQAFRTVIEAAKVKAGGAAPQIDAALAAAGIVEQQGGGEEAEGRTTTLATAPEGLLEVSVEGGRQPLPTDPEFGNWQDVRNLLDAYNDPTSAFVMGAVDTATFGLDDEVVSGIDALSGAIQGQGSLADLYRQKVAAAREFKGQLGDQQQVPYLLGQIVGGAAMPIGANVRSVRGLAGMGAAQGGAYGFGSAEGNPLERLPGATTGAAIGGGGGALIGAVAPRLSGLIPNNRGRQEVLDNIDVIQAGQRQNIPIRQPDARPTTRADFAGVEASETGNPIVTRALNQDRTAVEGRLGEVGGQGRVLDDDFDFGQRIQTGGDRYLKRTKAEADAKYTHADKLGGNPKGEARDAVAAIDRQIAELTEEGAKSNKGAIAYLNDVRSDLSSGASIAKLRGIRRNLRGQLNERNLTHTDMERRIGIVLDGMAEDIKRILPDDALKAFGEADAFYRQRMEFKDQVIRRFVGPKNDPISPETAAGRFQSFMKSKDFGRFSRMMDELEPGDRSDIAATVAEQLGKGRNGEFSLAALATNTDPKNFSPKALEKVFGKDGAAAIQDLRIIARAKADTAGALNNSRSGVVAQRMGLKDAMMGIFGGSIAGVPGAIGGLAFRGISEKIGNRRLANALLNPDFTKWLKNMPNNPKAAKPYISQLTSVASRSGTAAADIKAIQSVLADAFAQSPARAAAQQEDNGGDVPPNQ